MIDTKHWKHATSIPTQNDGVSISVARDLYFPENVAAAEGEGDLTNVDGPYAISPIEAGVLLFRASENPDLQLGRSTEPNCELVETEDGELVVLSIRSIAEGEFFCIAHSDDEEDEEDSK